MSGSKRAWGGYGVGIGRHGGSAWCDASPRHRCPVCGADSWCQIRRDGAVVLCKRVEARRRKINRDGVEFYIHALGAEAARELPPELFVVRDRADVATLDRAYRAALAALQLEPRDRDGLRARGLDDEAIRANEYTTLLDRGRSALARAVINAVGEHTAPMIPGIIRRSEGSREWWSFGGASGLVVPMRDIEGNVFALKVRHRMPEVRQKYLYVSSAKHDGASALSALHIPARARELGLSRGFVVTEGELKADVSTHLWKRPVVSVPGVGVWRPAVDLARAVGAQRVGVAFDMDADTNTKVAQYRAELVAALRAAGITPRLLTWDRRFKGLDDYLAARARGEVSSAR